MPNYSGVWKLKEVLEYIAAGEWPYTPTNAAAAFLGVTNNIQRTFFPSLGSSVVFTDAFDTEAGTMACSSSTRGVWAGGATTNVIQYVTFSTAGSEADFGDLLYIKSTPGGGFGNETRGIFAGGQGTPANSIQYITIASTGNASDFGDLTGGGEPDAFQDGSGAFASTTRGVIASSDNASKNTIDYVTIASTGNATTFGLLTGELNRKKFCGASNSTRGLFAGGWDGSSNFDIIDYVTIASTGNTVDFGNLTESRRSLGGSASSTRALFQGGSTGSIRNTVDYVEIASTGNAVDFGDLAQATNEVAGCSNAHGGLA